MRRGLHSRVAKVSFRGRITRTQSNDGMFDIVLGASKKRTIQGYHNIIEKTIFPQLGLVVLWCVRNTYYRANCGSPCTRDFQLWFHIFGTARLARHGRSSAHDPLQWRVVKPSGTPEHINYDVTKVRLDRGTPKSRCTNAREHTPFALCSIPGLFSVRPSVFFPPPDEGTSRGHKGNEQNSFCRVCLPVRAAADSGACKLRS